MAAVLGGHVQCGRQIIHRLWKHLTFDLQPPGTGGAVQACSRLGQPKVIGDPVKPGGRYFIQLGFQGLVALAVVILHGPE